MAEFALGLTKTAVESTVSLVKSAIEEDAQLKEKVQNDLVFITGELEMVQSFLRVANNRERARNDQVVLTWVRQLRCLAFDCVEFVLHLDLKSRMAWLRRAWQKVYCCAPPLPLDTAIAEIKQLKARVEDVSHRNKRYSLILHSSNNNNSNNIVMPQAEPLPDATTYPSSLSFRILRDAWKATGKWCNNMCNLQELILSGDDGLQVISVWGSTIGDDLGTETSILTKAYWDPEICEKYKSRAWVKLMYPCFNHDEFVKTLLAQFYVGSSSHQANAGDMDFREEDKLPKLMQKMREQRYLLVLENVLTVAQWNVIRMYLPNSNNGSRVIVSTPQSGIAILCTGEPYQVSELTKFRGDNQFLCAFSENKTPRDKGEFYRQLRRHGVISVWGADGDYKSYLVDILYKGIIYGWFKEFEWISDADKVDHITMLRRGRRIRERKLDDEVEFKQHSWVDVPDPLNLKVFAQRLFLNFHSDNIRANEITKGGMMGEAELIEWCRKYLFEEDCLVVINGLQSIHDWDLIKSTFLSSKPTTKSCIIVITNEEIVATHCVQDHKYQSFSVEDLKVDTDIATMINKAFWRYGGIRGMNGRLFYHRRKHTPEWTNKFSDERKDKEFGVFTVRKIATDGILRDAYYSAFQQIECRSWVDVPNPFDLTDFSWRLLLDFYSDDPQAKEAAAVGLMEGTLDPIQKCREFLRRKCLVIINDLRSEEDWDLIKNTFLSEHIQSIVIVRSYDRINKHCSRNVFQRLVGTQSDSSKIHDKEYYMFCYTERCQEALQWTKKFLPSRLEAEIRRFFFNVNKGLFSVWGIPGVGKSTIVKTIYYTKILGLRGPKLNLSGKRSYEAFCWVNVPSPFNLTEFAWRLLLDLYSDDPEAKKTVTVSMMEQGQVPILECCKILQEISCFVVIDGLRSTQDWDSIKATFLSEPINKGTTIVVITNEGKVAMHCVKYDMERVLNIRRLEADAALNLLEKITARRKELTSQEKVLLKSVVTKCGGLPKVICTIADACGSSRWWLGHLNDNFMGTLEKPEFYGVRTMFSWMQSYFDACSDSLKPCIFYLSIFSAEKNIRRRRLLWRWVAEGYCRDTSDGTTYEESWENFVSDLVSLSIVQESPGNKVFWQINGFFHEYIISRPMEDNLVFALEGRCKLNTQRAGQHLTIRSSWDRRDRIVYDSIDFSRLRSLTVFGKWESFFISSKKVNMRLLRVLDLEDATHVTNKDLEEIAKLLTRLKFLSLRGRIDLDCLPSSVGGLRQLQTLDIRGTSIVILPLFITKLQKLRYIRAGATEVWNWEADVVPRAFNFLPIDEDHASQKLEDGDGMVMHLPRDCEDRASSSAAQVTILPAAAAAPTEGDTDSTSPALPADTAGSSVSVSCNDGPRTHNNMVSSFLSKLCRSGGRLDNNGSGVTVPEDIGKLCALHTLGVVKVNAQCCKAIFDELKKLTQLCKLGVSGINKGNIIEFFSAISDHAHLKSLSLELDKDNGLDDNIPRPPETIKSLKLYGRVHKSLPVWIYHLYHLEKLKLDLTIEKPEELLRERPEFPYLYIRQVDLRIRPIQDGELHIGPRWLIAHVLEIQCSSKLLLTFDQRQGAKTIEVLKIYFSSSRGPSLQISGLSNLWSLKEVWLKGHSDAHKQYMQQQIDEMERKEGQERPVLKLVQTSSS